MKPSGIRNIDDGHEKIVNAKEGFDMKTITQSLLITLGIVALLAGPASAGQVSLPNVFQANTPAVAGEVNANFNAVKSAVDDNDSRITSKQNRVTGTCPAGESIRVINEDGTVECEEDTVGSGSGALDIIAYASISSDGTILNGSSNVSSCLWNASLSRYEITITGENYFYSSYATMVTPFEPVIAEVGSVSGLLLVTLTNTSGNAGQHGFQFVTFKP
jgi:hypothetical protein